MVRYVMKRVLMVIPILFGVTLITFAITNILPGDPALVKAGQYADPVAIAAMRKQMGLDKPVPIQYLMYLNGILHGDFGRSWTTGQPVLLDLKQRLPATLELTIAAMVIAIFIGVPLGVVSAVRRDSAVDHVARIIGVGGISMPVFWTGLILILIFFYELGWFPGPSGRISSEILSPQHITGLYLPDSLFTRNWPAFKSSLSHLVLPAGALGFVVMAPMTRMARSSMLEVLESDYVTAAIVAGLPRQEVIYRNALRNALIPIITIIGIEFGYLMGGNVVTEIVFAWPGIGQYAVNSLLSNDAQPMLSFVFLIAVIYVILNLVIDIIYAVVDPRIRLG